MPRSVYGGAWPRVRKAVLERDAHRCQIQGPTCRKVATCVDHIIPVDDGGQWWDPANLRASCFPCNNARRSEYGSRRWRTARAYITLVIGHAALQYVSEHKQSGDVVIDHTTLTASLGSADAATQAVSAAVSQLRRGTVDAHRVWITSQNPQAHTLYPHHRVVNTGGQIPGGSPTPTTSTLQNTPIAATASRAW